MALARGRRPCIECQRPIVAWRGRRARGQVKRPDRSHDLCQRCWKAQRDRAREIEPAQFEATAC